ncbi:MAG: biotin--[acetyl-CoA-carboxylase] ligase, partial [Muribaculaceae bacterium]|nr:biotin--[acetyl-CoA-carboxylase] ligase [Muribaculaceae bacterium]
PLDVMLREVAADIINLVEAEDRNGGNLTQADYMARLWRREGLHHYRDATGEFMASIDAVAPDGTLTLRLSDSTLRTYAFKEVTAIL